jgi:DNA-binding IclR family transcriptional regulator
VFCCTVPAPGRADNAEGAIVTESVEAPRYPIESVDNALRLLGMLRDRRRLRVSEAARDLGIAPSTAHRLLSMLQYHGFVDHDPATRSYLRGRALVDVGLAALNRLEVRRRAHPALEQLARDTGETVHLVVLEGGDILFVDAVESGQVLRAADRTGSRLPAHATASGKALLADLDAGDLAAALGPGRLARVTPRTVTSRAALERELAATRARGYAVNRGESEEDLWAVAARIPGLAGGPDASLVVSAPGSRVDDAWVERTGEVVQRASDTVAAAPMR